MNRWVSWTFIVLVICLICLFPHAVFFLMGATNPSGWPYLLLSGFVPSLGLVSIAYPYFNCHTEYCWRYGRYRIDGHRVCWKCHPDPGIKKHGITREHLRKLHDERNKNLTP